MGENSQLNIFRETIEACSCDPLTGFFRTGCCDSSDRDHGSHTVCALMTEDFLQFSISRGNDLSTPVPQYNFPGLKEGDKWCLCANRWLEAYEADSAPSPPCRTRPTPYVGHEWPHGLLSLSASALGAHGPLSVLNLPPSAP